MEVRGIAIGDWVKTDDGISKVVSLPDAYHVEVEDNDYTYDEHQVYPVPLTEEILKANGFKQSYQSMFFSYKNFQVACIDRHYAVDAFGISLTLYHVHELQHALRLTGLGKCAENLKLE